MRFLLTVLGTHGDVLPFLALGAALRQRGHEVLLSAPAPFAALASRAGFPFHAVGTQDDFDRAVGNPRLWHARRGIEVAFGYGLDFAREVDRWIEANRTERCAVIASSSSFGARLAQDRIGVPTVTLHVMPMLVESRHAPPRLPGLPLPSFLPPQIRHWLGRGADRYVIDPAVLPRLNAMRAELGLPPVRRLRHWWNSPTLVLLMFPNWFAPPQPDWLRHAVQVGFPMADQFGDTSDLGAELRAFLDIGEPPVVFTYGSGMSQAQTFFRTARATCELLGRRGIFLAPRPGQIPSDLPEQILHLPYAPFSKLLPRCAALVHHGGIGTVAQALAAGIPQLVVPVAFDHFDEAQRLERLGLGRTLRRRAFTPARAAHAIRCMIGDARMQSACSAAAARVAAEDGVRGACDVLERLITRPQAGTVPPGPFPTAQVQGYGAAYDRLGPGIQSLS
ncbi:glycosyltransferase [Methylobacterium radiodurans]|uniref:Glycosyl transferase n=1 Tax=Methylobacterium radiodurans TaxID=2202828 RepID=A0A2U8VLF0_9HYPH|nr:glycosyltransferase [Methylobacterium radiodurans]AWN34479.1 glycosyl transferase [Methylobacterium radiodurans]